ncbi:MAG: [LysW]-lysine hydrolase [Anaerolineae bacterium]
MSGEVLFLQELIAIPSPSGQEDVVAEFLIGQMEALGFQTRRDQVGNVVGTLGDPAPERRIVLLGHMDTVPGRVPVRREGERIYGRGAVDAKGSLAAFVLAAARVRSSLRNTQITVIGAVEEEASSRGARHLAATLPPPDYAIIGEPSGWQGITLGYKGNLRFHYRLVQPAGHTAGPLSGPAQKAVDLWNHLMDFSTGYNHGRSGHYDTLDPALLEFTTFSDGLTDGVEMKIALRLPPDLPVSELQHTLQTWCNGARLDFYPSDPAFQADKHNPLVRAMLQAIRQKGGQPRFKLKTGTSDMNVVGPAWRCPIIAYGPGDSSLDHTPHEHLKISEFLQAIDVLTRALEILSG